MWVVVRIRFDKMFGKKVLVPTIYVGCSMHTISNEINFYKSFSTHDIRGL